MQYSAHCSHGALALFYICHHCDSCHGQHNEFRTMLMNRAHCSASFSLAVC